MVLLHAIAAAATVVVVVASQVRTQIYNCPSHSQYDVFDYPTLISRLRRAYLPNFGEVILFLPFLKMVP